ncbi:MAG: permease-like cell division protein FtsX [Patescibacteria group bacterium]|mgnify:FL=1
MIAYIKRLIQNGWRIFRSKLTISFFLTLTVILITVFLWQVISANFLVGKGLNYVEKKLDFSIYFKDGTDNEDIKTLQGILENFKDVDRVILVNKEKAFEEFKFETEKNPVIFEALKEIQTNPLSDYLIIKGKSPKVYEEIAGYLDGSPYRALIEFITYAENQKIIKKFISLSQKIKFIMGLVVIFIGIFCALLIFNSTILMIYSQKDEIEVLKLIGASNFFIRSPFLIFSVIITILGFLVGSFLSIIIIQNTNQMLLAVIPEGDLQSYVFTNFLGITSFIFGFLLLINLISTGLSLQKYLKI